MLPSPYFISGTGSVSVIRENSSVSSISSSLWLKPRILKVFSSGMSLFVPAIIRYVLSSFLIRVPSSYFVAKRI